MQFGEPGITALWHDKLLLLSGKSEKTERWDNRVGRKEVNGGEDRGIAEETEERVEEKNWQSLSSLNTVSNTPCRNILWHNDIC